ncbi:heat-inducible transcriptional repressor HrcA, partial [Bifidobacteriaceae bacterium NR020]
RYFVDGLASVIPLSEPQRRAIRNFLSGSVSLQDTLQRSARLLASITGQVALVASPALSKSKVKRIEIVQVSSSTLLVVVITDTGGVAQHMIQATTINSNDLLHLTNMVNECCIGLSLSSASQRVYALANRKDLASALQIISQLAN